MGTRRLYIVPAVLIVGWCGRASAAGEIFKWVDARGNLHATGILADVPEPYYGMYAAELKRREEAAKQRQQPGVRSAPAAQAKPTPPRRAPPKPARSAVDELEAAQKKWRDLIAYWRGELGRATARLAAADGELAQATQNPVLRQLPEAQQQAAEIEKKRQQALAEVEKARRMLLEDLPQQARREGVPPRWLE